MSTRRLALGRRLGPLLDASGTHEAHSGTHEAHSGTHEAHSGTHEAHSGTHEAHSGTHEAHSGTHEAHSGTHEAHSGTHEAHWPLSPRTARSRPGCGTSRRIAWTSSRQRRLLGSPRGRTPWCWTDQMSPRGWWLGRTVPTVSCASSRVRPLRYEPRYRGGSQRAVATVARATRSHGDTAFQRFGRSGPVALLPLRGGVEENGSESALHDRTVSVIWSATETEIQRLTSLADEAFRRALGEETEGVLGDFVAVDRRLSFPVRQALAVGSQPQSQNADHRGRGPNAASVGGAGRQRGSGGRARARRRCHPFRPGRAGFVARFRSRTANPLQAHDGVDACPARRVLRPLRRQSLDAPGQERGSTVHRRRAGGQGAVDSRSDGAWAPGGSWRSARWRAKCILPSRTDASVGVVVKLAQAGTGQTRCRCGHRVGTSRWTGDGHA